LVDHAVVALEVLDVSGQVLQLELEDLVLLDQRVSLHSSPGLGLPVLVLMVDHSDRIPHDFEVFQIGLAVSKFLVLGLFQFEQFFEIVEVVGFLLDVGQFQVVFVNKSISHVDHFEALLAVVVKRQSGQEFLSESFHFLAELDQILLDIGSFLSLQGQNISFDLEHLLGSLIEKSLGVVNSLQGFFVSLVLDQVTVEFQDIDHLFDSSDDSVSLGLNILHVGNNFHDVHQEVLVGVVVSSLGRVLNDSLSSSLNKVSEVFKSGLELIGQELGEHVDPGQHFGVQRVLQWL
jgi:hypothetical protein